MRQAEDLLSGEMSLIRQYFLPLASKEALGMGDDGAVFNISPGHRMVIVSDTLVEGVHFFSGDPPDLIGQKLLRCNLSDLAAMGAIPKGWLFNFTAPSSLNIQWLAQFCRGLDNDQNHYGFKLWGGDTTSAQAPLVLSATLLGEVKPNHMTRRSSANIGDSVWVSGTIGDSALGLMVHNGEISDPSGYLLQRYLRPSPRVGISLYQYGGAVMDISDGLIQDAQLMALESGVDIEIDANKVPLSRAAQEISSVRPVKLFTGGDDYELLFTVSPQKEEALSRNPYLSTYDGPVKVTKIGRCRKRNKGVVVLNDKKQTVDFKNMGWSHF